jgi:hypothetical protein
MDFVLTAGSEGPPRRCWWLFEAALSFTTRSPPDDALAREPDAMGCS